LILLWPADHAPFEAAAGRGMLATFYAYAVRQLGYGETNKECAIALVHVAIRTFDSA
jgi:hypothetical protein